MSSDLDVEQELAQLDDGEFSTSKKEKTAIKQANSSDSKS